MEKKQVVKVLIQTQINSIESKLAYFKDKLEATQQRIVELEMEREELKEALKGE